MINVRVNQTDWELERRKVVREKKSGQGELIYIWGVIMVTIVR